MEFLSFVGLFALLVACSKRKERAGRLVDKGFDLVEWTVDQVIDDDFASKKK